LPCSIVADFFEPNLQFCISRRNGVGFVAETGPTARGARAAAGPDGLIGMLMGFAESDPAILDLGADQPKAFRQSTTARFEPSRILSAPKIYISLTMLGH